MDLKSVTSPGVNRFEGFQPNINKEGLINGVGITSVSQTAYWTEHRASVS